jgi:hypothetical protein
LSFLLVITTLTVISWARKLALLPSPSYPSLKNPLPSFTPRGFWSAQASGSLPEDGRKRRARALIVTVAHAHESSPSCASCLACSFQFPTYGWPLRWQVSRYVLPPAGVSR